MKHILKTFTVPMSRTMERKVGAEFAQATKHTDGATYMLALQPMARLGELRVTIIGVGLGEKIQKVITKHKAQDLKRAQPL